MEENENTFKSVSAQKTNNSGYFKTIILPFVSGIIGASLVVRNLFWNTKNKRKNITTRN